MRSLNIKKFLFSLRSAVFGFAAAGLFYVCAPAVCCAQRAGGDAPSRFMERIDAEEGARMLAAFRTQRLDGDYCFRFELEHLPRRGKKITYYGTMWGSWGAGGPVTRFKLYSIGADGGDAGSEVVEYIIRNGVEPAVWIRRGGSGEFERLVGAALFEPVVSGVCYTPFDLQMPFVYWQDYEYEGPARSRQRIVQQFRMLPPADSAALARGVDAVRIGIDDTYDALLLVEVLGEGAEVRSRFEVGAWKKVQDQWIVREITLKDYASRDRTRFEVKAASVGLVLNPLIFDANRAFSPPSIPEAMFDVF